MNNDEDDYETLELKVTVRGKSLDRNLAATQRALTYENNFLGFVRANETPAIQIVTFARADGQEIGLRYEFESWWEDSAPVVLTEDTKVWAWEAFKLGYELGEEK